MNRAIPGLGVVLGVSIAVAACGLPGRGADPFADAGERSVLVRVQNMNLDDMTVTAVAAGRRHELGMINGRSTRHFTVPWSTYDEVRFHIDPATGRRFTTRGVTLGPGESVELVIQHNVRQSFVRR